MANEETSEYWGGRFERLEDYGADGRLNLRSVKLFTDGKLILLRRPRAVLTENKVPSAHGVQHCLNHTQTTRQRAVSCGPPKRY